jgi:hypothetical protein
VCAADFHHVDLPGYLSTGSLDSFLRFLDSLKHVVSKSETKSNFKNQTSKLHIKNAKRKICQLQTIAIFEFWFVILIFAF